MHSQRPHTEKSPTPLETEVRKLGYEGASASELMDFATEMRKLYKTAVPQTGAQGLLDNGLFGAIGKIARSGVPNTLDQQRALKALIDSL